MYLVPGVCLPGGVSAWGGVSARGACLPGGCLPRGCLPGGCLPGGCLPGGACLPGGDMSARGACLPGGCIPDTPPPPCTEFLTHAYENITLLQTSFAGGNEIDSAAYFMRKRCDQTPTLSDTHSSTNDDDAHGYKFCT